MLKARMDRGITFLKQDFGIGLLQNVPGTLSMPAGTDIGGGQKVRVPFMANVHCAAATESFVALEHHSLDVPWWEDLVRTTGGQPLVDKGFAIVPDTPGLGVELNEATVRQHLRPDSAYFKPTPEWDKERSNDRLWS